jgi:L-asparaginase II
VTGFDETRFDATTFVPIAVASRSGFDESLHYGAGVVLDISLSRDDDADPRLPDSRAVVGDPTLVVYPRSCLKPMQAHAMTQLGLDLPLDLLAVACASHSGEGAHLDAVERTLSLAGLTVDDLQNTPARPYGVTARDEARRAGIEPSSLQQNCSGKHAAMLATCNVNGWPVEHYLDQAHPLQQAIAAEISRIGLQQPDTMHIGIDGCGAPTHAIPLHGLANAFGWLASTESAVSQAMRAHPELVGGTNRDVTAWMRAVPGLIAKEGAAGVMAAALPDGRAVAYKIADGSDAARQAVMPEAMRHLGVDPEVVERAAHETAVTVLGGGDTAGRFVGLEWPGRGWRA